MGCLKVEMPPSRVLFNSLSVLSFLNLSAHAELHNISVEYGTACT